MSREHHLTRRKDFVAVHKYGKGWSDKLLVLKTLPNTLELNRFGFSVSKKVGKAVVRNKVKRRLREATRSMLVVQGWDLLFIARNRAGLAEYDQLKKSAVSLLKCARLVELSETSNNVAEVY